MVGARVTPTTVLPSTQRVVADVTRCVRELERIPASRRLLQDVEALQQYIGSDTLHFDVVITDPIADPDQADAVARWIAPGLAGGALGRRPDSPLSFDVPGNGGTSPVRVEIFGADRPRVQRAAEPRPAVLVCVSARSMELNAQHSGALEALCEDRPYAVLLTRPDGAEIQQLASLLRGAWYCECGNIDALPAPGLCARLSAPPWRAITELLRAHAVLNALRAATDTVRLFLEQDMRDVRVRRAVAQQHAGQLQQLGLVNATELLAEIRGLLQQHFADFERGVADRLSQLLAPQIGDLGREIEKCVGELRDLEREEKSRTNVLMIPDDCSANVLRTACQSIRRHCLADLKAMRDLFQLLQGEVDRLLDPTGTAPGRLQFAYINQERLERLLTGVIRIDKPYRGELPRRGLNEYLMGARRYQGLLYLLGPIVAAVFHPRLREMMAAVGFVLLGIGLLLTIRAVPRERAETLARELEKARESLRGELRRISAEVERAWSTIVTDHLREQMTAAQGQVQDRLRSAQARQGDELAEEKRRLQRQLQGLEVSERQSAAAVKSRETLAGAIAQLQGELRQVFFATLGQVRGKPA